MSLPLIDLHCHIEGAADPAFVRACARRNGVRLPEGLFRADGAYACNDFLHFLRTYESACTTIRTPQDYADLTYGYFSAAAAKGLIYAELFISSVHPAEVGIAYPDFLEAIEEGYQRAHEQCGVQGRFILTAIRHLGPERAEYTARLAHQFPHKLVTGFGMAGDENQFEPADFARAFNIARDAGLQLTVHAGEVCGPQSVTACLDALRPARIGHGVRSIEDKNLVRRLADEGTVLEICPGSNIALGVCDSYESSPLKLLRDAGIKVALGSDDPPYFHTGIANEYAQVQQAFALSDTEMAAISRTAIEAAFCDVATKTALLQRLVRKSAQTPSPLTRPASAPHDR